MEKTKSELQHIGAMELFGVGGFSFYFGYALLSFWWLFTDFPAGYSGVERGLVQAFVFLGLPFAYTAVGLLKTRLVAGRSMQLAAPVFLLIGMILPLEVLAAHLGVALPMPAYLGGSLCAGLAGGFFSLSWLDGCGSARVHRYLRFTSAGVVGGAVLLFLVVLTAPLAQPLFAMLYLAVSFLFMRFLKARTDADVLGAPQPRRAFLPFKKEVEPSIFVFGVVFGLSFALLMISGVQALLWGMFAVLLGAAVVLLLDVAGFALNVTITQRALLVVAVAACLVIPFADGWARLVCLCFNAAAWAAFNAVNWSILVRMSAAHKLPVFYSIAAGASVSPWGFVAGWILSLVFAYLDFSSAFLSTLMLLLAFLLVAVLMLFIPNSAHHDEPAAVAAKPSALRLTGNEMSEKALFWMRVDEISRLYGLSPRERDVLGYLVKGRNANYIQKELVVSPHTAKSHIYNIYRKLDIHSQQKLMDFVEEFPLEIADPPGTSRRP